MIGFTRKSNILDISGNIWSLTRTILRAYIHIYTSFRRKVFCQIVFIWDCKEKKKLTCLFFRADGSVKKRHDLENGVSSNEEQIDGLEKQLKDAQFMHRESGKVLQFILLFSIISNQLYVILCTLLNLSANVIFYILYIFTVSSKNV